MLFVMLSQAQSQVSVVFERSSVARWKRYENANVEESILFHFRRDENGTWERVSVDGTLMCI